LSFDAPAEQVWATASRCFGQTIASSLQSAKWDKRVQALKAAGSALRDVEDERERTARWSSACLVLNILMRDKVMPVRLASHDLFMDVFGPGSDLGLDVATEDMHFAIGVLLQHLIDRLGDSNLRLHESARRCIALTAEEPRLLGLTSVLEKLQAKLWATSGPDKAKVFFGILDAVNYLIRRFPERAHCTGAGRDSESWSQHDVSPFIVAGMHDSLGPRVRGAAASLAVTIHAACGLEAMAPMLAGLRPAKQAFLKQKLDESQRLDTQCSKGCRSSSGARHAKASATPPDADRPISLPGTVLDDGEICEESFMDGILEDVGMVFTGGGIIHEAFPLPPSSGRLEGLTPSSRGTSSCDFGFRPLTSCSGLDDACALEQQLRELGLEFDSLRPDGAHDLDEELALLSCRSVSDSGFSSIRPPSTKVSAC
jgi:hypothetical protein